MRQIYAGICERDGVAFFFKQMGGKGVDNSGGAVLNGTRYTNYPAAFQDLALGTAL